MHYLWRAIMKWCLVSSPAWSYATVSSLTNSTVPPRSRSIQRAGRTYERNKRQPGKMGSRGAASPQFGIGWTVGKGRGRSAQTAGPLGNLEAESNNADTLEEDAEPLGRTSPVSLADPVTDREITGVIESENAVEADRNGDRLDRPIST